MRIHKLSFGALGPYPGEHIIDFDALGGSALFIIDGPTGAGKSTILDALVFALYADVSGSTSDKQRLRSAFADSKSESYAEVEFSTAAGSYKVRRTPEFERSKIRGEGVTTVPATTGIWRATGEHSWESISVRHREADLEISRVIGLDKHQFQQTVVLPQGEFATFLKAKSTDRQLILEKIFATSLYSRIQEQFDELRRAAERDRQIAQGKMRDASQKLIGRFTGKSTSHLGYAKEISDIESLNGESSSSVTATLERIKAAQRATALAAKARVTDVQNQKVQQDEVVANLKKTHGLESAAIAAATNFDLAIAAHAQAVDSLGAHQTVVDTEIAETDPDLAIQNLDEEIGALADLDKRAAQLPALKVRAEESAVALAELQGAAEQLTAERSVTIPAKLQAIAVQLNGERQRVEDELTRADEFQSTLFVQRLAGIAGELGERLVAGAPCPVCGSLEHPVPTQSVVAPVSERALADAKSKLDIQSQARIQIERQISLVETVMADGLVDEIQTPVAGEFSAADVDLELGELQQRLAKVNIQLNEKIVRAAELRTLIKEQVDSYQRGIAEIANALGSGADINGRIDLLKSARAAIEKVRITSVAATQAAEMRTSAMEALASSGVKIDAEVLTTAQSQLAALVADEQLLLGVHANLLDLANAVESLGADVAAAALEVDELAERIGPIIRIADVLNGRGANSLMQPLKAYVVQQMFDEVISAANIRLSGMLAGRFALVDTEQATGRERSLGLGLEIADLVSETNRRTETLSGGETFCASLALALGLADTVKSHAGGVDIGVLFVDEGFGALDQERLDDVMTELLKLRADGRTVGVISHVSEMKKSIMERITVIPLGADKGSTLEVSWMQ